jgi:hypothetical protein
MIRLLLITTFSVLAVPATSQVFDLTKCRPDGFCPVVGETTGAILYWARPIGSKMPILEPDGSDRVSPVPPDDGGGDGHGGGNGCGNGGGNGGGGHGGGGGGGNGGGGGDHQGCGGGGGGGHEETGGGGDGGHEESAGGGPKP